MVKRQSDNLPLVKSDLGLKLKNWEGLRMKISRTIQVCIKSPEIGISSHFTNVFKKQADDC